MTKALTTRQFFAKFPNDEACLAHLFEVRFGQSFPCPNPKCGRETKWYRIKAERAFSCQFCGHHLHPTVGTPFEGSRTSLQSWFYAIHLFTTTRHGVSGKELQRQLGVTYKTAWRMANEIRKHMGNVDGDGELGGAGVFVEIDETIVGGYQSHADRDADGTNKTIVLGMLERGGELVTEVVSSQRRASLLPHIADHVDRDSIVHTDENAAYSPLNSMGYTHFTVNHSLEQYVGPRGETVNSVESFWRHLKKSIEGTHTSVSGKHLGTYAKEFEFRFNRRARPASMLADLLSVFPQSGE